MTLMSCGSLITGGTDYGEPEEDRCRRAEEILRELVDRGERRWVVISAALGSELNVCGLKFDEALGELRDVARVLR